MFEIVRVLIIAAAHMPVQQQQEFSSLTSLIAMKLARKWPA